MFSLLAAFGGWSENKGTLRQTRVFEYTAEELIQGLKPAGVLDSAALKKIPALFAPEIGSDDSQIARIGMITSIRSIGPDYEISYTYDNTLEPIALSRLSELSPVLDIAQYELNRTHWAVKNVDLFYALLIGRQATVTPRVFSLTFRPPNKRQISIMMPFDAAFNDVYATIKTTVEETRRRCHRADDIWRNDAIVQDIVELIETSAVIVCDVTQRNPNVFYEAGIAHTLGRDVIIITQSDEDVPFNLRHLRYIKYLDNVEGRAELAEKLRSRIQTLSERP